MKKRIAFLMIVGLIGHFALYAEVPTNGLELIYDFSGTSGASVPDVSGNGFNATLQDGATIETTGDFNILKLGNSNGYLDMGAGIGNRIATLNDFSVATYLYIDSNSSISGNGFFAWTFSTSNACSQTAGKYLAYRVNAQRYAITTAGWGSEKAVQVGSAAAKGAWHHVAYVQSGTTGTIYIDGAEVATATISQSPTAIGGGTTYNWLGRPPFSSDSYLKGASYYDFRIYNRALSATEVGTFTPALSNLNSSIDIAAVDNAKANLTLSGIDALKGNLTLLSTTGSGVAVAWSSSNTSVLANNGAVTRPGAGQPNVTLTLTATLSKGNYSTTKAFTVTVLSKLEDAAAAQQDADNISINTNKCYSLGKINLPTVGAEGSLIKWESSAPDFLTVLGDIVKLPAKGQGTKTVTLVATITKGSTTVTKNFDICVKEDDGFVGYLWVYFKGDSENIYYGLSSDGYSYKALNSGNMVISADTVSLNPSTSGLRDPQIMRGPDGKFYMVATDMRASLGWESNHGIVLMKSDDMINWKHSAIDIKAKYPQFNNITRAWAPETIYDEKVGKYMVYFSMKTSVSGSHDIIYYAYANADFTDFESAPQVLFDNGYSTIDGCIVFRDGEYNLFFKTEDAADKGYKKAVSTNLTSGYVLVDKYLDQSSNPVEGGCVFKLNNQDKYILMYDLYTTQKYEFTESTDLLNFAVVTAGVSRDFAPRHGTIMGITAEEAARLVQKWGNSSMVGFGTSEAPEAKPKNIEVNETAGTVFIPVKQGTDLASFDPRIVATVPGVAVSPQGAKDFSHGAVSYSLSLNGTTKNYSVTSAVNNNPVIPGYYADPEILYSEKTGRFYIYPTTDGFPDWGGYAFNVFSSVDLVNWSNEGTIVNMHDADQISWANGNAWAPCIVEKKVNGEYKNVFYFSGG
ncbi:MAG TPA: immunoglobulin-like domain-containing protein, partial [Paludibacter sp.]|nr:immunoglobulin-like domain-containing protein [Paludibacter sp.]